MKIFHIHSLGSAAALFLTGCAVGPDFKQPDPPDVRGYTAEALIAPPDQRIVAGSDVPAAWWEAFQSPELNTLIAEALVANPDVQAARAALTAARENVRAQQGVFFPSIQGSFETSRNQDATGSLSPTTANGLPVYSLTTGQVSVSYLLDVFGGNRRQLESTEAQADAQMAETEAAYLALTANIAAAAIEEASLRGQIAATERIIAGETDVLRILRRQAELGQIAEVDVAAEEAALAQTRGTLPPLQQKLAQQRGTLSVLGGRFPSEDVAARFDLDSLHLPGEIPLSVPAKLVDQRPDVRLADANLHAATAAIGIATANLLPNITLTANAGSTVTAGSALFAPGTTFWNLAAGLTQPIFQGGMLLHKKRAAVAAAEQATAQYRSAVLNAFQNVADALHAIEFDAAMLQEADTAERAATETLEITRRQLDLGQVSGLALLNAERTSQQTEIALVQAKAQRLADAVALFQALGGGWWNRGDPV